ncbi:MAG TPA: tetratricopeptide repeat protein [Gaiellales bacterium]|nr:tetratricopeptide repeat protein [Gaiellales bacterium]
MIDYAYDLGSYTRPVSTSSADAQAWFDRGLVWAYGFNHEEAVRCFQRAAEADPACAMAHWGIAYALGPNYNKDWDAFDPEELAEVVVAARAAVERARSLSTGGDPVEQALIEALGARFPESTPPEEFSLWSDAYAAGLRTAYARFGDDQDVASLFAEALICRTPWQLWDLQSGEPSEGADTLEALAVLERAIGDSARSHPGLLHMYVHAMEMSPFPERAAPAAEQLRELVPDAGHLRHMPTHIDVLCGRYREVITSNERAIEADQKFLEREGALNFYTLYRCHNHHFKIYGALFLGQMEPALEAADELAATLTEELLRVETPPMADWVEGFVPMRLHVLVRFGRWREIIDEPLPADPVLYAATTAMLHYAKGVAHAATGDVARALEQRQLFREALTRLPETRYVFNNTCADILAVASEMLDGEIAYRSGDFDEAFAHLRRSVELDDNLAYDEPWGWMQPSRHALGALLLEQGKVEEAEAVYRADLGLDDTLSRPCRHPGNVWSLHGYHECLSLLGKCAEAAAIKEHLDIAVADATVPITGSCFCRGAAA